MALLPTTQRVERSDLPTLCHNVRWRAALRLQASPRPCRGAGPPHCGYGAALGSPSRLGDKAGRCRRRNARSPGRPGAARRLLSERQPTRQAFSPKSFYDVDDVNADLHMEHIVSCFSALLLKGVQAFAVDVAVQDSLTSLLSDHVARMPSAAAILAPSVELLCQALASLLSEVCFCASNQAEVVFLPSSLKAS